MNSLVPQIAVSGGPDPMPIVMQSFTHQGFFGSGPAPQIVIDLLGHWLLAIDLPDCPSPFVAKPPGSKDFPQVPLAYPVDRFLNSTARAALGSGLHDTVVLPRRNHDLSTFPDLV